MAKFEPRQRKRLTDRFINSCRSAAPGERDEHLNSIVPGLALRVTDRGHKTFVLRTRIPGRPHFTRRALGDYGRLTLDEARTKARAWFELIERGQDPTALEQKQRAAAVISRANTFGAVAQDFIARYAKKNLVKADECERVINSEFVKRWRDWPIADVTAQQASAAVRAIVERGAPYQARNAFQYLRTLFNWTVGSREYGVDISPLAQLRPGALIGKGQLRARDRLLTDAELRAVWRAADGLAYPYGPLVYLLLLTGQRLREVAEMEWSEIDLAKKLWTIPALRMKGGGAHEVPLPEAAVAILEALPEWKGGDFVFTTTAGEKPVNGFSKAKVRLDRLVAEVIQHDRAQATRTDGEECEAPKPMPGWVFHDLRRTMRSHLSALPVQDLVRELVIAHARPGLHKVYDLYAYRDEKRHCLELWEARLEGILTPRHAGDNVVALTRVS